MICKDCQWAADMPGEGGMHAFCKGGTWYDCQHKIVEDE